MNYFGKLGTCLTILLKTDVLLNHSNVNKFLNIFGDYLQT
jgi:hypothetical protein